MKDNYTVPSDNPAQAEETLMMGIVLLLAAVGSLLMWPMSRNNYWIAPASALGAGAIMEVLHVHLLNWWKGTATSALMMAIIAFTVHAAIRRRAAGDRIRRPLTVGLILMLIVGLLAGALSLIGASAPKARANATNTPDRETINSLIVTTTTVECKTDSYGLIRPWDIGALKPVGKGGRVNSDDVSTPFTGSTAAGIVAEAQQRICNDPLYGAHWANFFARLWQGKVVQVNPWLQPFSGTSDEAINTAAASFVVIDVKNPTAKQSADAIDGNKRWQVVAPKIATLLGRLTPVDIEALPSILNYHVLVGGLVAGGLPAIGLNDTGDNLPAAVLKLTKKGQSECELEVGINREDGRAEEFACSPTPSGTPTTPGTPTHPGTPPGTTPPGGCTTNCVTTPPTTSTPTPSPTCTQYTSSQGTCFGGKTSASPAPSVGNPHMTSPGSVSNTPPPPKGTPLTPQPGGSTSQPTAPGATPVPSYDPPPPNTGAPTGPPPTTVSCIFAC